MEIEADQNQIDEIKRKESDNSELIDKMCESKQKRVIVNIDKVRQYDSELGRDLMEHPLMVIPAFEDALRDLVIDRNPQYPKDVRSLHFSIGVDGPFGNNHIGPRELGSRFLCQMVCVEGIVTKTSLVRPKVIRSVHYCPATKKIVTKQYHDATSLSGNITSTIYPTKDDNGNRLETEFGYCEYMDHQSITIQEMPERAPMGQLPRSIDIIIDDDLVDKCKAGDRVEIIGIYKAISGNKVGATSGIFRTVLLANNIKQLNEEVNGVKIGKDDIKKMKNLSKKKNFINILSNSIAPSLFGHEYIKKALLLMLLGGEEKNLDDGTHIRGDINILLVGDPSCGKSQMLRFILNLSPLAINTTGRGSSGVGLTAAVTSDNETGERRLEAGAMVLADRGVVCIDEFDKMSDNDRVAIHEVMEQQTVTIAKAGIHCSLNARCSVLAAANPVYGQYDPSKKPQDNVGLPDSLLSRFDLLFIVRDILDPENDNLIADHILRLHQYQHPGREGKPEPLTSSLHYVNDNDNDNKVDEDIFLKSDLLPFKSGEKKGKNSELLTTNFLKKYIQYAKRIYKPVLTAEASKLISDAYIELRQKQDVKTLPITARLLETLIRFSTAHAKARFSNKVEKVDCLAAIEIVTYALYHDAKPEKFKKIIEANEMEMSSADESEVDESNYHESDEEKILPKVAASPAKQQQQQTQRQSVTKRKRSSTTTTTTTSSGETESPKKKMKSIKPTEEIERMEEEDDDEEEILQPQQPSQQQQEEEDDVDRNSKIYKEFVNVISGLYEQSNKDTLSFDEIVTALKDSSLNENMIKKFLQAMENDSKIMFSEGLYYKV